MKITDDKTCDIDTYVTRPIPLNENDLSNNTSFAKSSNEWEILLHWCEILLVQKGSKEIWTPA